MSHHHSIVQSERLPLLALLMLVLASVAVIVLGQAAQRGLQVRANPDIIMIRSVVFLDGHGGLVSVLDAETERQIATYTSGEGGFIRTALRALAYSRRLEEISHEDPFVVARTEDGQILLHDPSTQKTIGISAFGEANIEQFAQLLPNEEIRP